MPEVTLSLPVMIGLVILLLVIGAGVVYAVLQSTGSVTPAATATPTVTATATVTITPTATLTATPEPTWTALPPVEYKVAAGDTCLTIAYNFNVSSNSIILLNNLSAACDSLYIGQPLLIPQPTPTPSPQPTSTLNPTQEAEAACDKMDYQVKDGDTLMSISLNYNVSQDSIRQYNGLTSEIVYLGMNLVIPLCERISSETATPTPVPPYNAPDLLLPADGASFTSANDVITLQWAAVGELRENESYAVTIEDITEGTGRKPIQYVKDTKLIVPAEFAPVDASKPHVYRWSVLPVRQTGTNKDTQEAIWEPAGAVSSLRVFTWIGSGSPAAAPTPTP